MHPSGRPAVTDFGLAMLDERNTTPVEGIAFSERTLTSRLAGTPAYMSPEQFMGQAVGPASDQFSFGVALYEALCRRRPFEGKSVPELSQRVIDGAFEFPSDASVRPWLRSVLERMLRRNPSDRFPSMDAVLQALDPEPVRRRRRLLGVGAVAALSVAVGGVSLTSRDSGPSCDVGASTVAEVWHPQRRDALEQAIATADLGSAATTMPVVYAQLDAWSSSWASAYDQACESTHLHGVQSQERLDARVGCFEGQLEHLASLVEELEHADADALSEAYDASVELPGPSECDDPSRVEPSPAEKEAAQWHARARVRNDLGRYTSGLEATTRGLAALGEAPSPQRVWLLTRQGQLAQRSGDNVAAEVSLRDAIRAAADAPNPEGVALAWLELSMLVGHVLADSKRADGLLLAAEAAVRALHDPAMDRRLTTTRGSVWIQAGRVDDGLAELERAIAMSEPETLARGVILGNYGNALFEAGRYRDALNAFDEAYAIDQNNLPPGHPSFVLDLQNRSRVLNRLGRNVEAVEVLARAIEAGKQAYGPESSRLGGPHLNLGVSLIGLQRYDEATAHIERAVAVWTGAYPEDHRYFDIADTNLGIIASEQGDYEAALRRYRAAKARVSRREGSKSRAMRAVVGNEANALYALGRYEEAAVMQREALALAEAFEGPEHPSLGYALVGLARALVATEAYEEAAEVAERARRLREGKVGPAEMYLTYITLADAFAHLGALEDARRHARAASAAAAEAGLASEQAKELHAFEQAYGRDG